MRRCQSCSMDWDSANPWLPVPTSCPYCGSTRFTDIGPAVVYLEQIPLAPGLVKWYNRIKPFLGKKDE